MKDRAWIEIDHQALNNNYQTILRLANGSKVMGIVKDHFYGLGIDAILTLKQAGVDFFAVASIDEAIELRKININDNILVLGSTSPKRFPELLTYNLIQSIVSLSYAEKIIAFNPEIRVHLKINTGMNRLGIAHDDLNSIYYLFSKLKIEGIFSHLLAADENEGEAISELQIKRFNDLLTNLKTLNLDYGLTHLFNSAGILKYGRRFTYDYVRPGICFSGIKNNPEFENVLSLKCRIIDIHDLNAGENVGYGHENQLSEAHKIGVIAIGYGDGLSRQLAKSNYRVYVNEKPTTFYGRLCMDISFIYLDNIDAQVGDVVTIIGKLNTVEDMALALETIPNEIMTHLKGRLPYEKI